MRYTHEGIIIIVPFIKSGSGLGDDQRRRKDSILIWAQAFIARTRPGHEVEIKMTTPLYSNAMLREINEGVEAEIKYAGWGKARNRHSIVFNKPRVCLKYHYPSHCILSFSLPWFTPKVLEGASFPERCQGASRICGLLMINRQSGSIVCAPSLSFYPQDLIEMMTLVKCNPLRKDCVLMTHNQIYSASGKSQQTSRSVAHLLIAMNEVFTSTNFSRINLDKHQLLKQMVFISTGSGIIWVQIRMRNRHHPTSAISMREWEFNGGNGGTFNRVITSKQARVYS